MQKVVKEEGWKTFLLSSLKNGGSKSNYIKSYQISSRTALAGVGSAIINNRRHDQVHPIIPSAPSIHRSHLGRDQRRGTGVFGVS